MKTIAALKKTTFGILLCASVFFNASLKAQTTVGGNGTPSYRFEAPQLQSEPATDLKVGARYLFTAVYENVDAVVTIDSLVNGATVNKIDDNSNGTGFKEAFQPAVKAGTVTGMSYAVFTISFYAQGTNNPVAMPTVNATAIDIDGNTSLKEFANIKMGTNAAVNYMIATPDISVTQLLPGEFFGANVMGIERNGIDTSYLENMFTVKNTNITSFTVKYGAITTNTSGAVRQFSLYMKGFSYPGNVLPVKLISFSAMLSNNNKVDLKWATASEINLNYFQVEKSTDGINYSNAAIVFAAGNGTDRMDYSLADNAGSMESGVIYYRLRSVDNDGKSQLSDIRIIRLSKANSNQVTIAAYPNPVTSEIRVTVPAGWQNKKAVYEIVSLNGQTVKRTVSANSSQTEIMSVSNLAPGMYVVKVSCEGQVAQQRIVKQ